jgi:hypothetical protein
LPPTPPRDTLPLASEIKAKNLFNLLLLKDNIMAILATYLKHAHKYDLETAAILRSCASVRLKYPEFIATLLFSPYVDDIKYYAQDPGFCNSYKQMLTQPTDEELLIQTELEKHLPAFSPAFRMSVATTSFKWPTSLTNEEMLAWKETMEAKYIRYKENKPADPAPKLLTKKDFYSLAMACDEKILEMPKAILIDSIKALKEENQSTVLSHWYQEGSEEFKLLSDEITNLLYL